MKKYIVIFIFSLFFLKTKGIVAQYNLNSDSLILICDGLDLSSLMRVHTDFEKYTDSLLKRYKRAPQKVLKKLTSFSHKDLINNNMELSFFIASVYPFSKERHKKSFYKLIEKTGTEYWSPAPSPDCFIYALYEKRYLEMNLVELENLYQLIAIYSMYRWDNSTNIYSYEKLFIREIKNRITDLSGGVYLK